VKKAVIAILALLYIITTSGVVVNVHYCMGAVASVTYGHQTPDSCGTCGMKEKEGCCHSELKVVKLEDDHQQTIKTNGIAPELTTLPVAFFQTAIGTYDSRTDFGISYHSPPDPRVNAVYLHTTIFRI
jgi:hypothetical protein